MVSVRLFKCFFLIRELGGGGGNTSEMPVIVSVQLFECFSSDLGKILLE